MERQIFWVPWQGVGLESLRLVQRDYHNLAQSVVIGIKDHFPFHLRYEISCDRAWRLREFSLELLHTEHAIRLRTDGAGNWTDATGKSIPFLTGCFDVDISATPFTNTLPIRRLALSPGQSRDVVVAYISIPDLQIKPFRQRYTYLNPTVEGGLYRYEHVIGDFKVDLPVDSDGLVMDYPDLFKRVS